mgnify:CR=1 FL=1
MSQLSVTDRDREEMLAAIGVSSVDELFEQPQKRLSLAEIQRVCLVDEQHGVGAGAFVRAERLAVEAGIAVEKGVRGAGDGG